LTASGSYIKKAERDVTDLVESHSTAEIYMTSPELELVRTQGPKVKLKIADCLGGEVPSDNGLSQQHQNDIRAPSNSSGGTPGSEPPVLDKSNINETFPDAPAHMSNKAIFSGTPARQHFGVLFKGTVEYVISVKASLRVDCNAILNSWSEDAEQETPNINESRSFSEGALEIDLIRAQGPKVKLKTQLCKPRERLGSA